MSFILREFANFLIFKFFLRIDFEIQKIIIIEKIKLSYLKK